MSGLQAAPLSRVDPAPATPVQVTPASVQQNSAQSILIEGLSENGSAFVQRSGASRISIQFGDSGIAVSNLTVQTATTLTADITVPATTPVGDYPLTVINPDGQSATSTTSLLSVLEATGTPQPPANTTPPPATPYESTPGSVESGTSQTIVILASTQDDAAFIQRDGRLNISAAFSGTGITVDRVTVLSPTSLSLDITVAAGTAPGGRTLTVTNPDGQSASSSSAILTITEPVVVTPPPATPYQATPGTVEQNSTQTVVIDATSSNGAAFLARDGQASISATFSDTGVTVNRITVISPTSLSLDLTIDATAPLGGRTLTVTNPDGQSVTSNAAILTVIDPTGGTTNPGTPGGGNVKPAPPTPYSAQPGYLAQGALNHLVQVFGTAGNGEEFIQSQGNTQITASFNGGGITVNSVTVSSPTALTVDISIAADAPVGGQTITVTNPDGQSATSTDAIFYVTDPPEILSASITPTPPSTVEDLEAQIEELRNLDGRVVTYQYQWFEDGQEIAHTSFTLPESATTGGRSYSCRITPIKDGVVGASFTTSAAFVTNDKDNNGIHDAWEKKYNGRYGMLPNGDDDGDGLSNRAEYLFGLDPQSKRSANPIAAAINPATGEFKFTRPANQVGNVVYKVWVSTDLRNWTERALVSQNVVAADHLSETVAANIGTDIIRGNRRLFIRLSAE